MKLSDAATSVIDFHLDPKKALIAFSALESVWDFPTGMKTCEKTDGTCHRLLFYFSCRILFLDALNYLSVCTSVNLWCGNKFPNHKFHRNFICAQTNRIEFHPTFLSRILCVRFGHFMSTTWNSRQQFAFVEKRFYRELEMIIAYCECFCALWNRFSNWQIGLQKICDCCCLLDCFWGREL